LNLPKLHGTEVLRRLKQSRRLQAVPVVVLSSTRNPLHVAEAYHSGASCFITKPEDLDEYIRVCSGLHSFWFGVATLPKGSV
jgi:two-component system, chemotaxis family, response regulator Rcp1